MKNTKRKPQPIYEQSPNMVEIKIINLPNFQNFKYYPEQGLVVLTDFQHSQLLFYKIKGNDIELMEELTQQFNNPFQIKFNNIIYLQNSIIIDFYDHIIKLDVEDLNKFNIILDNVMPKCYYTAFQVNRKCFARSKFNDRLIIYSIKNIKISHTILKKPNLSSAQFYNYIVQASTRKHLYYYNIQMTKQIRKFSIYRVNQSIFNSNYLFVPIIENEIITQIHIYDICSMKVKHVMTSNQYELQFGYKNCIFLEELNVIVILYAHKLDIIDFNTFQCVSSQKIGHGFSRFMQSDIKHGLTIFQQKQ